MLKPFYNLKNTLAYFFLTKTPLHKLFMIIRWFFIISEENAKILFNSKFSHPQFNVHFHLTPNSYSLKPKIFKYHFDFLQEFIFYLIMIIIFNFICTCVACARVLLFKIFLLECQYWIILVDLVAWKNQLASTLTFDDCVIFTIKLLCIYPGHIIENY